MASPYDPFDEVLRLEERFYSEGFRLGVEDGHDAGLVEGRLFGLEKGFEKYLRMGELSGRATFWASSMTKQEAMSRPDAHATETAGEEQGHQVRGNGQGALDGSRHPIPTAKSDRLTGHIRSLYALTEPASLSTGNNEGAVADFDDRLKRAQGKLKIIEKLTNEADILKPSVDGTAGAAQGGGGIEDVSSLHTRH